MSTQQKEAATSKKNGAAKPSQKAVKEIQANIDKIGSVSVSDRLDKLDALNGLKTKHAAIKEAENKLNEFEATIHKGDFKVSFTANGAKFETQNATITQNLVDVTRKGIEALKMETEKEIVSFNF